MKLTNCVVSESGISTILDRVPYTVNRDHANYDRILKVLKTKDGAKFLELYNSARTVLKDDKHFKVSGSLVVGYNNVTWNGQEVRNTIVDRILQLQKTGQDTGPISKFLEKALSLPKENAEALFAFIETKGLSIHEDGDVLAWKVVEGNYKDKHSRTIDNKPGTTVPEIPRSLCDSDNRVACSKGYHVGNLAYSGPGGSFYTNGDKIVIVKFNPANTVSVPSDVTQNKLRVTQYTVVEDYKLGTEKKMEKVIVSGIDNLIHGDRIKFYTYINGQRTRNIVLKFEGVSKKNPNNFYGRLLKGTKWGEAGRSASFEISKVKDLKKV